MIAMLYFVLAVTIATPIALAAFFIYRAYQEAARRKQQRLWREEFQTDTGIQLPPNTAMGKMSESLSQAHLSLRFPRWEYGNRDGTRDKRRNYNGIIYVNSELYVSCWHISMPRPWDMLDLVRELREKGYSIPLCAEEQEKKRQKKDQLSNVEALSLKDIVRKYEPSPTEFEEFCASLFRSMGYRAKVTPKSNDGGYDIYLSRGHLTAIAECKCYALDHKIGRPAIQKLVGANMIKQASKMLFITTSSFSAPAEAYVAETGVKLVDGRQLLALVEKYMERPVRKQYGDTDQEYWLTREDLRKYIPSDIRF